MSEAVVTRRHAFVTGGRSRPPQTQNDPEGGIPSGSLEVLGGLTKTYVSFIGGKFFRLMLCFVSIVSSAVTLPCLGWGQNWCPIPLKYLNFRRRSARRRRL